ncbi:MAG TPA: 30S ribosomal protein S16, partial [Parachlamydiaceae bacterium]|nr:30S ribosomal protein S16 [Parachlamydiaceae bacterium]
MALKIRLRQQGRTNSPFYRIVLTDVRAPRDGKYLEVLGWYNPFEAEQEKNLSLNAARIQHWLNLGAEISDTAEALVAQVAPSVI